MKIKVEEAEKRADLTTCLDITKRNNICLLSTFRSLKCVQSPYIWMCRSM